MRRFGWLWIVPMVLYPLALRAEENERETWAKNHPVSLKSISPDETDFEDPAAFGKAVGDARIVFLGEQTHGDGATFLVKTRLIKYLHEEKGFDVLAFESGRIDCEKRGLRSGRPKIRRSKTSRSASFRSGPRANKSNL